MSSRAPIGYLAIAANEVRTNQGFKSFILAEGLEPQYVLYWLRFNRANIELMGRGSTFREVSGARCREIPIIFPPCVEQKRIVERVESLLDAVKGAQKRLAAASAILSTFRQSVLAAASSGRLTEDWRESTTLQDSPPGRLPSSWQKVPLNEVCKGFDYGSSKKSMAEGDVPVIRMGNLQDGAIDWSDLKYSSDALEIKKYSLKANTVLFNRTNSPSLVGKTAIYKGDRPAIFAGYLIRILHGPHLDPEFLNYSLNSSDFREYCSTVKTDGVSQSNINAKKLASYKLALPPKAEQHEIVRRVKALLALADEVEAHVRAATLDASRLPQAIFARAFRGELVPTEARLAAEEGREYEPASLLLERIRATRQGRATVKPRRGDKRMPGKRRSRGPRVPRSLDEVLREQGQPMTPERLFEVAGFSQEFVDDFYDQLRILINNGDIRENRPNHVDVTLESLAK